MKVLIRETNENLKTIINTMKENLDSAVGVLENIQTQMDKKVEEAKKYKIQVDAAKENIRKIEEDNRNLELSLNEINEKYSKMNLVSLIEAGNKEIKSKINDNLKAINKNKEQIAELTSKAKTIKDLLINLKKDKTAKEEKLENLKTVYEFYSKNLNEIIEYAYEHTDDLESFSYHNYNIDTTEEDIIKENVSYNDLDNTMVFDEIADIDENKNFKDEITFINDDIDNNIINTNYDKFVEKINSSLENEDDFVEDEETESDINLEDIESTKVFDSIITPDYDFNDYEESIEDDIESESEEDITEEVIEEETEDESQNIIENEEVIPFEMETNEETEDEIKELDVEISNENNEATVEDFEFNPNEENTNINTFDLNLNTETSDNNTQIEENNTFNTDFDINENTQFDFTTNNRINEISELLTDLENTKTKTIELNNIEEKIENVLKEENNEEIKESTLTDIFGNPIKSEDLDSTILQTKKIEEMFVENGVDFHKFKEDEQNYLKQIYDENKFAGVFNVLNKHKINVDNLYHSFNIFGEIDFIELDNIINKLVSIGQSIESIGIILEKMPKIKKYNLDEAIASFNDEIKTVNITELIMRAKELYNGGNK